MPRLGLGSLDVSSLGGTGQDVVTTIDDFFFESFSAGEIHPMLTTSRTNLVPYSQDFSSYNFLNGSSDTSNYSTSPDGTENATRLQLTAVNLSRMELSFSGSSIANKSHTVSCFVKSNGANTNFRLKCTHSSVLDYYSADLTATSEWQRFTFTQLFGSGSSNTFNVGVANSTSNNAADLSIYGLQLEQGSSYATSYIPTSGSPVTVSTILNDTSEVWDFDGTDIMIAEDPEDEGFWEEGSNLVLNHDYEELGSELVTNGDFATDSDWIKATGWSISDGTASISDSGSSTLAQSLASDLVSGKTYKVVYTVSGYSGSGIVKAQFVGGSTLSGTNITANGTHTEYLTATANHTSVRLKALSNNGGFTGNLDNFSIKQVDPNDRWTLTGGTSISDGKMTVTGASGTSLGFQGILVQGTTYELTYTISNFSSSSGDTKVIDDNANTIQNISANGTFTVIFTHAIASGNLIFRATSGTNSYQVDNVTVKEYAVQPKDI